MEQEKRLLLKKALFNELKRVNEEIGRLYKVSKDKYCDHAVVDAKLSIYQDYKDFIQHLIDICVDRNKF